jgi:hypothetical protein
MTGGLPIGPPLTLRVMPCASEQCRIRHRLGERGHSIEPHPLVERSVIGRMEGEVKWISDRADGEWVWLEQAIAVTK